MESMTFRRISQIEDDVLVHVVSWGPLTADITHWYTVRGVTINRTAIRKQNPGGQWFRLCIFPDGREMYVNEGNIRSHRHQRFAGENKHVPTQQQA